MSLRSKIVLILCCVVVAYTVVDNIISRRLVAGGFVRLEAAEAQLDLDRAVRAIESEIDVVAGISGAHAQTPTLVDYVVGERPGYVQESLGSAVLEREQVDVFLVLDEQHVILWGQTLDPTSREPIAVREIPLQQLDPFHPLLSGQRPRPGAPDPDGSLARREQGWIAGPMQTGAGLLLAAASPVHSQDGGRVGTVIVGRFLGDRLLGAIGERLSMDLEAWPLEAGIPIERSLLDEITSAGQVVTHLVDDDRMQAFTTLSDIRRLPELVLRAELDRRITKSGFEVAEYAMWTAIGAGLFILSALLLLLQRMVLQPLGTLTSHAVAIGQTDDTSRKVGMQRSDEFGQLSEEFDRMIERLADSRAAHAEVARQVGMSEIATGVLHNVGNVLNSVNVSANLVKRNVEQFRLNDIEMMLGILKEHENNLGEFVTEDPRGKHLLPFLTEVTSSLQSQRGQILGEAGNLAEGLEHIMELVRSQQSYAGLAGLYESGSMEDQLEAAVTITQRAQPGADDVEFERHYEEIGPCSLDKRKVTEIFVNLIQNARHSMAEHSIEKKRIVLSIERNGENVRVSIRDNGAGIEPENLARIFGHGFTTKRDGHGFGLHTCANAATEMRGTLHAESDGPGTGATFILELPRNHDAREHSPAEPQVVPSAA